MSSSLTSAFLFVKSTDDRVVYGGILENCCILKQIPWVRIPFCPFVIFLIETLFYILLNNIRNILILKDVVELEDTLDLESNDLS